MKKRRRGLAKFLAVMLAVSLLAPMGVTAAVSVADEISEQEERAKETGGERIATGSNVVEEVKTDELEKFAVGERAVTASGICGVDGGDNLTWMLEDGVLTISGSGEMMDSSLSSASKNIPWVDYVDQITNIVIDDGVANIGRSVFCDCSNLTNVIIPDSVTSIGSTAFYGCRRLTNVEIPSNMSNIGSGAFMDCSSLTNIVIPDGITSIESYVFGGCTKLVSVVIPDSVTDIGDYAFYGCSSLVDVVIPDSVTNIGKSGKNAFGNCSSLKSIVIPDSVTSIAGYTFSGCNNLEKVKLSTNITTIREETFANCTSLTGIRIPDGVNFTGVSTFLNCSNLNTVIIPGSMATIDAGAFKGCSSLSDVYYEKSESDWNNMTIQEENEPLLNATIHYNSNGPAPAIISELDEAVLYVPYSDMIEAFNFDEEFLPVFHITEGTLPQGLELNSATGQLSGTPLETGRFEFTVEAFYNGNADTAVSGTQVITVKQNTDENVYGYSDQGYELRQPIGDETMDGYILTEYKDQMFVSEGAYEEFIALWLNGEKLVEGEHYTKEPGSTRITIRSQTFRDKAKPGSNTIAAEFKTKNNELRRTTQNFILDIKQSGSDGNGNGTGNTGEGSGNSNSGSSGGNVDSDNSGSGSGDSSDTGTGSISGTGSSRRSSGGSGSSAGFTLPGGDDSWIKDEIGWWYKKPDNTWLSGGWYLLSYNGEMSWYYFNEQGYMAVGWIEDKERKYYLNPASDGTKGKMCVGWRLIDGKWYYFNENADGTQGALMVNTQIGEYHVNEKGVWTE